MSPFLEKVSVRKRYWILNILEHFVFVEGNINACEDWFIWVLISFMANHLDDPLELLWLLGCLVNGPVELNANWGSRSGYSNLFDCLVSDQNWDETCTISPDEHIRFGFLLICNTLLGYWSSGRRWPAVSEIVERLSNKQVRNEFCEGFGDPPMMATSWGVLGRSKNIAAFVLVPLSSFVLWHPINTRSVDMCCGEVCMLRYWWDVVKSQTLSMPLIYSEFHFDSGIEYIYIILIWWVYSSINIERMFWAVSHVLWGIIMRRDRRSIRWDVRREIVRKQPLFQSVPHEDISGIVKAGLGSCSDWGFGRKADGVPVNQVYPS